MAKIEGFRVKNFKVLKEVTLGRLVESTAETATHPYDNGYRQKRGRQKCRYLMPLGSLLMPSSPVLKKPAMHEGVAASKKYGRKGKQVPSSLRYTTGKAGGIDLLHTRLT